MLSHAFEELSIKKQYRAKPKDKTVTPIGYDTETQGGLCKLLCSPSAFCLPLSFDDILAFLTTKSARGKVGFFYNLRYDFQAILKWLDPTYWKTLLDKGFIEYDTKSIEGSYKIVYIPGKMLSIRRKTGKKSRRFDFYDIAPFYGRGSLETVAQKYLGYGKIDTSEFDMANLTDKDFQNPKMIKYCKQDAKLTEDLAKYWVKLCNSQGLFPTTFASTASIASRYYLTNCKIPTINSFLTSKRFPYLKIPWLTCAGAFITVYKRGFFESCYEYDLTSAYPSTIATLPDISRGRFVISKTGTPTNAYMGWLQVKVDFDNDSAGFYNPPLPMLRKGLPNYFPYGTYITYVTLDEYHQLKSDCNMDVLAGLYWVPTHNIRYPFKDIVHKIFNTRQDIKDPVINYFYKIVLNSLFGKFLQRIEVIDPDKKDYGKWRTGTLFNPCYASYILADSRLRIYNALKKVSQNDIIACFTDSVLLRKPYPALDEGTSLGQWSQKSAGPILMVGCGVYTHLTKDGPKTKLRGFHTTSKVNLFDEVKRQYDKQIITLPIRYVISLGISLTQNKVADMNKFVEDIKKIRINFDTKRLWLGTFNKAGEYLNKEIDSLPLIHGG